MPARINSEQAATLALHILAHMVGDEDALERFMALTGMGLDDLKAQADQPGVLLAVLEYYLNHEPSLLAMAEDIGIDPALPAEAHHVLSGTKAAELE